MKKTILIAVLGLFAVVACKKEDNSPKPVANFTITSNDTLDADETFEFTNTSENATVFRWDFRDGTSATTTNATKNYGWDSDILTAPSGYNTIGIQLTAKNTNGDSSVITKNIVVKYFL
jgi:PKD repeat protein